VLESPWIGDRYKRPVWSHGKPLEACFWEYLLKKEVNEQDWAALAPRARFFNRCWRKFVDDAFAGCDLWEQTRDGLGGIQESLSQAKGPSQAKAVVRQGLKKLEFNSKRSTLTLLWFRKESDLIKWLDHQRNELEKEAAAVQTTAAGQKIAGLASVRGAKETVARIQSEPSPGGQEKALARFVREEGGKGKIQGPAKEEGHPQVASAQLRGGQLRDAGTSLKPDAQKAPPQLPGAGKEEKPKALGDIATTPVTIGGMLKKYIPGSQTAQTYNMLARKPTEAEKKELHEAYEFFANNTSQGEKTKAAMGGVPEEAYIRMNYAKMDGKNGVMIPRPILAYEEHAIHSHVSLSEELKGKPVEVRALVMGHEVGEHAMAQHNGFLKNKGSHIPSEYRAAVIDAQNYLEIRQRTDPARLEVLKKEPVWQQADLKARIVTGGEIFGSNYTDDKVQDDAYAIRKFREENPGASPAQVMQFYIQRKYKKSGEEGMENLGLRDNSAVGSYNKETDRMIGEIRGSNFYLPSYGL